MLVLVESRARLVCFVDGFSQSVPVFPVAFSVCFVRVSYASLM